MATFAGLTYENGYVPRSVLAQLDDQPDAFLRRDAAESWNRARTDVMARTGVVLTVRGWNRTYAEQERFFFERYSRQATGDGPFDDVRWYKGVRYVRTSGAPAAIPGNSNHGWGLAIDVNDFGGYGTTGNDRRAASIAILKRHGWTDAEGQSIAEPWHLVYSPAADTHPTVIQEDDDMTFTDEHGRELDDLHRLLLRRFADGDSVIDMVEGMRRDLIVARRTEADVNTLVAANRAQAATMKVQAAAIVTLSKSVGVDPALVVAAVERSTLAAVREALPASITVDLEG